MVFPKRPHPILVVRRPSRAGELIDRRQGLARPSAEPGVAMVTVAVHAVVAGQLVPVAVLEALAYQESAWDGHGGAPSASGGYGIMQLTDVTAANLDGLDPDSPKARQARELARRAMAVNDSKRNTPVAVLSHGNRTPDGCHDRMRAGHCDPERKKAGHDEWRAVRALQ